MKRDHVIVLPREDGTADVKALKPWLRAHPEELPGVDFSGWTSHQMRAALIKRGWTMQETPTEVRLLHPGTPSSIILAAEGDAEEAEISDDAGSKAEHFFGLENELRDFLATNLPNIDVIPGKRLRVYQDLAENEGVEYTIPVGRIDILAVDEAGDFYVFELKRVGKSDDVLGQVCRYMGWLKMAPLSQGKNVFGVIVAKQISERLRYAASVVPGVHLFQYEVSFRLEPAHEIG